ncbi:MAG: glycosyltransferase family 4 protein [Balneolaceae bacterium]
MNLLVLAKAYPPTVGGVENYSKFVSEGLSKFHDVRVLTLKPLKKESLDSSILEDSDEIDVERIHAFHSQILSAIWYSVVFFIRILQNKPDYILATTWKIGLVNAVFQPIFRIPFMLSAHGAELTRNRNNFLVSSIMKYVFNKADRIIAVSEFTRQVVIEYAQIEPSKCVVVSNGIDLESVRINSKEDARKHLNIDPNSKIMLTVSRVDKRKGHIDVLNAIPQILKKIPNLKYIIVGNGPEKEIIKSKIVELGIEDHVELAGFVSDEDLPFYYSACDVFVMLNKMVSIEDFEGFGFVFAEAGAYRKPLIGGNSGGPKEVILENQTGYLVDPLDSNLVAEKITLLLSNDIKSIEMGNNAEARTKNYYTTEVMSKNINKNLVQLYEDN